MNMNLSKYIDVFNEVKAQVGSDEVAAVIVDQIGKDARVNAMRRFDAGLSASFDQKLTSPDDPATEKQKAFLKRLGVKHAESVTRSEASELIDKAKA